MPFLRASNGSKVSFSQARLSALISLVYQEAMGDKTPKYRASIQKHCSNIWRELEDVYGGHEQDEWPGPGIYRVIEEELRDKADLSVHESFLGMKINEFQEPKKTTPKKENWKRFEGKTSVPSNVLLHDNIDPVWAVVLPKGTLKEGSNNFFPSSHIDHDDFIVDDDTSIATSTDDTPFQTLAQRMGVATSELPTPQRQRKHDILPLRRSQWLDFWKTVYKKHIPWHVWEKQVETRGLDQKHLTLDEWWLFWQELIDECMLLDPRIYELRRAFYDRQKRALLTGQHWLEGTPLWPNDTMFKLDYTSTGQVWYRRLAMEHLKSVFTQLQDTNPTMTLDVWDFGALHKALKPERDSKINWRAWQHFDEAGALWSVPQMWSDGSQSDPQATEMPQWAMMRISMHMALVDVVMGQEKPERCTQNAIELYDQMSNQHLMPSASVFREAGKHEPRFFEDKAWAVSDDFSDIQKVIHSNAVDTVWTGTVSSVWRNVRSKNSTVRQGRRRSTGVNDFLKTIDAHMKAQGRMGEERPVTPILPCWHMDAEEFILLRHENGQRLQPVLLVSDLFMQRMAENGTWTFFDPHVYPEVKDGAKGYLLAEQLIQQRKKDNPKGHKTVGMERLWRNLVNLMRQGSPFVTFEESDRCYSIQPNIPLIHGLDGVGAFSVFNDHASQALSWPSMVVNIGGMISPEGEPMLDEWRETLTWAFWLAEKMYLVCDSQLSEETKDLRPLCLGPVGFYEAIQKSTATSGHNEHDVMVWVSKISEAWGALVTVIDQVFCQKYGPAPIWNKRSDLETFHPQKAYERLKKQRKGAVGAPAPPDQISELYDEIKAHRFSVRTVWAPFKQLASWAGVSPGGFGTLFPVEWVMDEKRVWRLTPTNYFMEDIRHSRDPHSFGAVFAHPTTPAKWPSNVRKMSYPTMEEWKVRLKHAAVVRPWIEQGISLTLPAGMPASQLSLLIQQSWWMGISNIRFDDVFKRPDLGTVSSDE